MSRRRRKDELSKCAGCGCEMTAYEGNVGYGKCFVCRGDDKERKRLETSEE